MLAYDYPILGIFWTMFMFFIWLAWLMLVIRVFTDIFRTHDMGGWSKALWTIFVIAAPFLGVFVYLLARGGSMAEHDVAEAQRSEADFEAYVKSAAGTGGTADELAKLADLKSQGVLTDAEFEQQKAKLLA